MATGKLRSPLTEDNVLDIFQDMDGFAVNMSKIKSSVLAKTYGWSDEEKMTKEIPFDLDMSNIDVPSYESRNISDLWNLIKQCMEFMRIDMSHIDSFINEYVDEDNDPDYEMFLKYTRGSTLPINEYVDEFVRLLNDDGVVCDFAEEYGERGYFKEKEGNVIVTGDWNYLAGSIYDIIEENGYEMEWSDQWIMDYDTQEIFKSNGDEQGELSYFWISECEIASIEGNEEAYIEYVSMERQDSIDSVKLGVSWIDYEEYGYEDIEKSCHETGMYGIWEDPREAYDKFKHEYERIVYVLCSANPFATRWKLYGKGKV